VNYARLICRFDGSFWLPCGLWYEPGVNLLLSRGPSRVAIALGVLFVACHSGGLRNLNPLGQGGLDGGADSDADVSSTGGTSGAGGMRSSVAGDAGTVGGDGGSNPSTSGGAGAGGDSDLPDASSDAADAAIDGGPRCGDGNRDLQLDEECDDGNDQHSDGCEPDCTTTKVAQMALGRNYSCALSNAGGVKCWGVDADGVLGRGTLGADITHPSQIEPLDFGTARRVTQISAGYYHACVRFEDGKARCWGDNATGQLGINSTNDFGDQVSEPLNTLPDLNLDNVQSITAGIFGTCAIVGNVGQERVYCWGGNLRGEQGVGDKLQREAPGQEAALGSSRFPKATIIGWRWVCGLLNTGAVRCWGDDSWGVRGVGVTSTWLGDNELPDSDAYNALGLPGPVTAISGNYNNVCALSGGDAYCWGRNTYSQTGYVFATYGDTVWQTPGKVNLGTVSLAQISCAGSHTCGLDTDGFVYCWGAEDEAGSLGYQGVSFVGYEREPVDDYELMRPTDGGVGSGGNDGGVVTPGLPLGAVDLGDFDGTPGPDRAISINVGGDRTCAIMDTGALRCWGDNADGLIGYPEVTMTGVNESPAQVYLRIGYSDVNVFGPPPSP
jgi:cysteine-rich repeat protein